MQYTIITPDEYAGLEGLDDWRRVGHALHADFRAGSFPAAAALVRQIADAAEALDHHPDIDIRYPDHVLVRIFTHVVEGLTTHDVDLARAITGLAGAAGARAVRPDKD